MKWEHKHKMRNLTIIDKEPPKGLLIYYEVNFINIPITHGGFCYYPNQITPEYEPHTKLLIDFTKVFFNRAVKDWGFKGTDIQDVTFQYVQKNNNRKEIFKWIKSE